MVTDKEIGKFMLGIHLYTDEAGARTYKFFYGNENVPQEAVITQLRAFLHDQEDDYFKRFTGNITRVEKED